MDFIVVEGVRPYDGRYEFDLAGQELTTREWGWIKRLSGYLPLTVEEGLSDPELIVVFAAIALRRAGKVEPKDVPATFERLSDAPFGAAITMETDQSEEVEEETAKRNPPPPSSTSSDATSGLASSPSSATLPAPPKVSGTHGSVTSMSARKESAS